MRKMTRQELDQAVQWAAREGWNPGLHDAQAFWQTDPDGFVALEEDGQMIGSGSVVSYQGLFGFMGFFIVREGLRQQGRGAPFWHQRLQYLQSRLEPGAAIGMDGVFAMQDFYARGGFVFSHRDIRFEGVGRQQQIHKAVTAYRANDFQAVADYDRQHFPCPRPDFLRAWLSLPESHTWCHYDGDRLSGYATVRRCMTGYKIGPLFGDNDEIAERLFSACSNVAAGEPLFLDAPEPHGGAMALAADRKMREVFGCARMYLGPFPQMRHQGIYGVTSFELG